MTTKNNIPTGYKDSAVGIIPQEWEVKRLGTIAKCFSGGTPKSESEEMYGGTIPFIRSGEIHSNKTALFLTDDGLRKSSAKMVDVGDLIFALYGANSGDCAISQINGAINQAILCIRSSSLINPFLQPYLELQKDKFIAKYLQGGQGNLSGEIVSSYTIPVPPMEEQRKIAEILGVWDEAIEKQSRLIEKLELRKRGLMQRLLTGRTRLPGFTTPWQKVKLGEIGRFISGCVFNENEQGGKVGFPFFKVSDMNLCGNEVRMTKSNNYVTQEQIERLNYIVVKDEAIIFAKVGAAIALERKRYAKDFIIDNNMLAYVPNTNIWYMKYWFDSIKLSKYIQVGALPSYNASDLAIIKLNLPSLPEQKAIAEVLTTADDEIATHRKKLDALRLQKRGLMQQLLTGKTRVKI